MNKHNVFQLFSHRKKNIELKENRADKSTLKIGKEQISLPFNAPHTLMFVKATNFRAIQDFRRFSTCVEIQNIIDMRVAPRLDFVGANRAQAFSVFESLGVDYVDMLGKASLRSYEACVNKPQGFWFLLIEEIQKVKISHHPVLFIFDNSEFLMECRGMLGSSFDVNVVERDYINSICVEEPLRI